MKADDKFLRLRLKNLSSKDSNYWEFRRQAARNGVHGMLQYPAMMVPQMQRDVLRLLLEARPETSRILDPFVGSGTVMTESMVAGQPFTGVDINPLAILTCRAKSHIRRYRLLKKKVATLTALILFDEHQNIEIEFFGRDKWFTRQALISLSRIRQSIQKEPDQWAREIFWTTLAETVRQTSNSRTSTYKLHLRPAHEIEQLPDPVDVFLTRLAAVYEQFEYHGSSLSRNPSNLRVKPALHCDSIMNLASYGRSKFALVVTSPPYGDNHSTVPYGQFSYLALSWIDAGDLPGIETKKLNTRSVDTGSLGGSAVYSRDACLELEDSSPSFKTFITELRLQGRKDLESKVISFSNDFFQSIKVIVNAMDTGGYAAWTLGNRTVGGLVVPLTDICRELHHVCGARHVDTVRRKIPSKRTPSRNSISETMSSECLLLVGT